VATVTATDGDNDTIVATASTASSLSLSFNDTDPTAPTLTAAAAGVSHDETPGVQTAADTNAAQDVLGTAAAFGAFANVAAIFASVPAQGDDLDVAGTGPIGYAVSAGSLVTLSGGSFGSDGAAPSNPVAFAIHATDGTFSGVSTTSGTQIFLYNGPGDLILGRVGTESGATDIASASGTVAFALRADPATGKVYVAQYLSVLNPTSGSSAAAYDELATLAASALTMSVTYLDGDNDAATSGVAIGTLVSFQDDGPTARPDTDDVGTGTSATGNVITDNAAGDVGDTDINAADTAGADGAVISAIQSNNPGGSALTNVGTSVTINGQYGTLLIESDGDYTYTRFGSAVSAGTDTFTYTLQDGDGDTSTATLTVTLADTGTIVVGSTDSDDGVASDPAHTVAGPSPLASTGPVNGLGGNDILIGDPGGTAIAPGDSANFVLVLDSSGSMSTNISGGGISRMQALEDAVNGMLTSLANSGAQNVRVHIIDFADNGVSLGTFNLISGGVSSAAQLTSAQTAVTNMSAGGGTNWEAGLQSALSWITTGGNVLPGATVNRLLFASDGNPTYWVSGGNGSEDAGNVASAMAQVTGSDGSNEPQDIEATGFTIEAIGIGLSDSAAIARLDDVEDGVSGAGGGGDADNITTAAQLNTIIGSLISNSTIPTVAGSDVINGAAGNDVIFGDVPYTDALATANGLGTSPGAGWQVFQLLEAPGGVTWSRTDTINYILNNKLLVATESARTGGHDQINGGAGDDIIFAQEGNDTITYNVGDGRDFVHGGSEPAGGGDTLIVNGDGNTQDFFLETAASYNARINPDYTGTAEALVSDGSGTIMVEMTEIESVTINGGGGADTLTVSGDFSGTSILNSTIIFNAGDGADTLDLTNRVDNRRVVADGGNDADLVKLSFAYSEVTGVVAVAGGFEISHDGIIDTITNFESYQFTDVTLSYTALTTAPGTPSITSVTDDVLPVTGTVANGGLTNDPSLVVQVSLTGTNALAGDKVQLFNAAATLGLAVTLTATDITNGYVDITTPALASGTTYALNAKVLDLFGTASGASANHSVTVDTVVPTVAIVMADTALKAGETSLVTFTFSEAVTGFTNADLTAIENGTLTTVSSADGGITWTATFTPGTNITDTTNLITLNKAGVTDLAGNAGVGSTSTVNYSIDTAVPTAPTTPDLAAASDSGSNTDNITNDTTPTFAGTAEAGSTVTIYSDGVAVGSGPATGGAYGITTSALSNGPHNITATATDAAGNVSTLSGTLAVTIDNVAPTVTIVVADAALNAGETSLVTFTFSEAVTGFANADITTIQNGTLSPVSSADGGITWTATLTPAASITDTSNIITVTKTGLTDVAGNAGVGTTNSNNYAIDTAVPAAPSVPDLAAASDTGTTNSDNITNDTTPTFTGTAEAGSTVNIYDGATLIGTGVATGGNYSIIASALSQGAHNITATATDAAGNVSAASAALAITIDTVAPTAGLDTILSNFGGNTYSIPEWTVLRNDTGATDVGGTSAGINMAVSHTPGTGTNGTININDDGGGGTGSFTYTSTDGANDVTGNANVNNANGGNLTGSALDEILVGDGNGNTFNGSGGIDIILAGGGTDTIIADQNDYVIDGGSGTDTLQVSVSFNDSSDAQIVSMENVTINAAGVTLNLGDQAEGFSITGSGNADDITGGLGNNTITGGGGIDTFRVTSGTDTISDLGNGGAEILIVSAGATANATASADWTATAATSNSGAASVNANGNDVNVANSTGSSGWSLTNSSSTAAALTGSARADVIISGTAGDTISTGLGTDTVKINAASATNRLWTVDLGADLVQDTVIFNHNAINTGNQTLVTVTGFNEANDRIAVTLNGTSITATGLQTITSDSTSFDPDPDRIVEIAIAAANRVTTSLADDSAGGAIASIIAAATNNLPATGTYTFIIYSSLDTTTADAGIYTVNIDDDSNPGTGTDDMDIEHIMTLTGVGFGQLTAANFANLAVSDPIVLDLDHNGVAFSSLENGVTFDINGDGASDQVAWTANGGDGILALDVDGSGKIENGNELFTPTFAGGQFADGLAALASLDGNKDGVISSDDQAFDKLVVWQDANHNGVSEASELARLGDLGIKSIDLAATKGLTAIDGQTVEASGSFTYADGSTGSYVEVNFDTALNTTTADHHEPAGSISLETAASLLADLNHAESHIDLSALGPNHEGSATPAGGGDYGAAAYATVPPALIIAQEQAAMAAQAAA
jgi:hypothetical protein